MLPKSKYTPLLKHLNIPDAELLGKGMEGFVFDFSADKVLKIWFRGNESRLRDRKKLYEIAKKQLQVPIPEIYEIDSFNDLSYTIENKISGSPGHSVYLNSSKKVQKNLLDNYFNLLGQLKSVSIDGDYGQLISDSHARTQSSSWSEFIEKKLEITLERATQKPNHDLANLDQIFKRFFQEDLPKIDKNGSKHLVHGDLFLENIMANEQGQVTGLLDFGSLSLVGDHLLDVATLIYAVTISDGIDENAEKYLLEKTIKNYPNDMEMIRVYTLYYCLFFINNLTYDPRTYKWCIKNLQRFGYINE